MVTSDVTTTFQELDLHHSILKAVKDAGYTAPTPIQAEAIPLVLDGFDLFGCAQTGTGKTAAFALPTLDILATEPPRSANRRRRGPRPIRALILAPTRELALQIDESFTEYGRHLNIGNTVVYGGVSKARQVKALRRNPEVLTACPGRLLDLIGDGEIDISEVELLILDEADQMLDMGFIRDIRKIVAKTPEDRQTLMFSATLKPDIRKFADEILYEPQHVAVESPGKIADGISEHVYFVEKQDKIKLLKHVISEQGVYKGLVFSRTKHGADKIVRHLSKDRLKSVAIHGNKSQNYRERALRDFRTGKVSILVATDVASRGLDIDEVSHVINYDLPSEAESYVHRIGRTARAGATGAALSFCSSDERKLLRDIERKKDKKLDLISDHGWHSAAALPTENAKKPRGGNGNGRGNNSGNGRNRKHRRGGRGRNQSRNNAPTPNMG